MIYKERLKVKFRLAFTLTGNADLLETLKIKNGKSLPPSYREFCKELGYGRLFGTFSVFLPFADEQSEVSLQYNLRWMSRIFEDKSRPFLKAPLGIEEMTLLQNAVPFAKSTEDEFLYWDMRKPLESGEYPIYYANFSRGIIVSHTGDSMIEMIERLTGDQARYVLIFSPKPFKAIFTSIRAKDIDSAEKPTINEYIDLFNARFQRLPFKDLLAFISALCEEVFGRYRDQFIQRKRIAEADLFNEILLFIKETITHPENYVIGKIDRYQNEIYEANKKLSRKKAGYDDTDQRLSLIGECLASVIHLLKTRDLIYAQGIMKRILADEQLTGKNAEELLNGLDVYV